MDETNFDTEWKWNFVSEEMDRKFAIFYTVSNEQLIKVGPMIWTVLRLLNKMQNGKLKDNKEDRDKLTTRYKDYNVDTYN